MLLKNTNYIIKKCQIFLNRYTTIFKARTFAASLKISLLLDNLNILTKNPNFHSINWK